MTEPSREDLRAATEKACLQAAYSAAWVVYDAAFQAQAKGEDLYKAACLAAYPDDPATAEDHYNDAAWQADGRTLSAEDAGGPAWEAAYEAADTACHEACQKAADEAGEAAQEDAWLSAYAPPSEDAIREAVARAFQDWPTKQPYPSPPGH